MASYSIPTVICEGGQDNAHCSDGTGYADIKNMRLSHSTSNANNGVIYCDIRMAFYGDAVPFSTRNIGWWGQCIDDFGSHEIGQYINTMVHGQPYSFDRIWSNEWFNISSSTTKVTFKGYFTFNKAAANWNYISFDEALPNTLRITYPQGLSGNFPTSITGNISGSITAWGLGSPTPMRGTPTSYPYAKSWNWSVELLDEYGSVVARKLYNTGETKSCSFGAGDSGWYTANALAGSASANATPYEMQAGKKYRFRITVSNDYNRTSSTTSGWYYAAPPEPTVTITSIIYNPTLKKSEMCFDWSLAKSGLTPEILTYEATLPDGTVVASGTIKTITNGAADSGTKCGIQVPTGDEITLTVKNVAGTAPNQMTSTGTAKEFSPVANAAFLGFDWDELRRICTIRAEAPGAANCRIEAGYQANVFDVGDKLTSGEIGELVVKDLDHGSGQILYLQATPESSSGHKYENEIAKISIPIPNPILGVYTPKCGSPGKQQYIVDIVERKKNCTLTPKWQNGDRVVKIGACGGKKMLLE